MNELQNRQLEILKEFIKVCKENNLQYYLVGGTCLGAVRHKGFIPWDDDIDVAMPREDFTNLLPFKKNSHHHILFKRIKQIRIISITLLKLEILQQPILKTFSPAIK